MFQVRKRIAALSRVVLLMWAGTTGMLAQTPSQFSLMPLPAALEPGSGSLPIDERFTVGSGGYTEPRLERAATRFLTQLHHQTGIVLLTRSAVDPAKAVLVVTTDHASKEVQEFGEDESYTLEITSAGAQLHAANPLGALHGLQTFLQLVSVTSEGFAAPFVKIRDQPRFGWRGLLIDCGRHFIPVDVIKRNLDGLEAVKMNVFHWHLSEDQGFRVESHKYPKLHELGSDGLYYTQEEIRDVIAYAHDRGIRVVPEFDMPGHSSAWFVAYPEIASGTGPYQIERKWGVFDPAMDPVSEKTYKFLDGFLGEMTKLFPDQYVHVGGDEVNGKEWDRNSQIQEYMKAHYIQNNEALQAYFSRRVQQLVTKHGKTPVGWDEILVPGVPKTIVVQSWRGAESLAAAAKGGYRGILSNGYYLDLGWSAARHYQVDPMGGAAALLAPGEQKNILGGESAMWSEYVSAENIDSRIWPRNVAIAERLWSSAEVRDVVSMYARLDIESERLEWLGLTHRSYQSRMLHRLAGSATPEQFAALESATRALEPVKDYTREENVTVEPTSRSPLNRFVDAVALESDSARLFSVHVNQYLSGSCSDSALAAQLRSQLTEWSDSGPKLEDLANRSALAKEAMSAIRALSAASTVGLAALNRLSHNLDNSVSSATAQEQKDLLNRLESQAHNSQIILPMLPTLQKLVEATVTGCALQP